MHISEAWNIPQIIEFLCSIVEGRKISRKCVYRYHLLSPEIKLFDISVPQQNRPRTHAPSNLTRNGLDDPSSSYLEWKRQLQQMRRMRLTRGALFEKRVADRLILSGGNCCVGNRRAMSTGRREINHGGGGVMSSMGKRVQPRQIMAYGYV